MTHDELPLDERIELLTAWRAAPPEGADIPELVGLLGATLIERYERDGDPDLLESAIGRYGEALRAAPDHEDRTSWYLGLGLAHGELAIRLPDPAQRDQAIEWLSRLYSELPPADPGREDAAMLLVEAHWERYCGRWSTSDWGEVEAAAEARELVAAVGALSVSEEPPEPAAYRQLVLGLGLLAGFGATGDRPDLDAGMAALAPALATLPPETDRYGFACAELCWAHQARADLDGDPASLDLAITTGERAVYRIDPDDPARLLLSCQLAAAYRTRWEAGKQPADLHRGIECLQAALDVEPAPWIAGQAGQLRHQRASLTDDAAEAALAVDLLERAAADQPEDTGLRYDLVQAYRTRWRLSRTAGSLAAADRCLDHLLSVDSLEGATLLAVHIERVMVAKELLDEAKSDGHDRLLPDAARLRRYVADAREALDHTSDADPDLRNMIAGLLALGELEAGSVEPGAVDLSRVRDLLARARHVRDAPPSWSSYLDVSDASLQFAVDAQRPGAGDDLGVREYLRAIGSEHLDHATRHELRQFLPLAVHARASRSGNLRGIQAAEALPAEFGSGAELRALLSLEALANQTLPEGGSDLAWLLRQVTVMRQLEVGSAVAATFAPLRQALERLYVAEGGQLPDLGAQPAVPSGPAPRYLPGIEVLALTGQYIDARVAGDLPSQREVVARVRELAADLPAGHAMRFVACVLGGHFELDLARRGLDTQAAAHRAADWYEAAAGLAGGPDHPFWRILALGHAEALRLAGDEDQHRPRSRQLGMSALRAHAWRAMQQSGTDFALESAAQASADARTVAGWCLDDRAHDDLVRVLDAGRGLALHAATASRQVAGRLVDAGHPELAEEWRATGGLGRDQLTGSPLGPAPGETEVPDDLRSRVLNALGPDGADIDLLETVGIGEIQRAFDIVGGDALVYLMDTDGDRTGTAVVVPASGAVETIALPELVAGPDSPASRHLTAAGGHRDLQPLGGPSDPESRAQAVDNLCRWAWSAAMGDLIRHVRRRHVGRPVRLVLVPMGRLALVPWHAACTGDGAGRRYAVQDAVISYSASARMFCAAARHQVRPARSALVVGDPDGSLPFAGVEARAIHQGFYPGGSYFGRHGSAATPAGTPEQVLEWVSTAAPGPSLLHFACHGVVDPRRPADAHLLLAGGTLTAGRLLEASRLAALAIDQVFLAACTTNVGGADYDEAFSLSTAFLASGARTVFGSLWPVPDAETSLLMYLVHHYINVDSCAPADALHRAQLWMLDPARQPPAGMPAELAHQAVRPEAADPLSWAAFTHLGR